MRTFTLLIGLLLCFIQGVYAENIPDENSQATDSISDQALKEVVVEHQTVKRSAQGDLITITKDMRLGTRNTGELLGNIPGGMYNSINRALTFYGSSNIIVLVDSIEHDFSYITRMNQNRFDKINITYNPTGKYRGYDAVINLKTRPHYKGYDGTVSLDGAIYTGNRNGNGNALGSESAAGQFTYTYDKINVGGQLNNSWSKEGSTSYSEDYYPLNGIRQTVLHTPATIRQRYRSIATPRPMRSSTIISTTITSLRHHIFSASVILIPTPATVCRWRTITATQRQ